ncbi:MAG: S4 domain-containing protein [Candidatus Pacebacteria bacterium]|nr:S4 domain-containing protein [Candidatus Paceibacterota bacterium]
MEEDEDYEEYEDEIVFPMRINRYLALNKHSKNRREADKLIKEGKVFINNKLAVLGDKVQKTDSVEVNFRGKPKDFLNIVGKK